MPFPATIHTFGFGYQLRSGLLKSIAEIGNGNYAFIPDAGMLGTVFVHAVANLQATYATNATLTLTYHDSVRIEEAMGNSVIQQSVQKMNGEHNEHGFQNRLEIHLGNLQYGQSRDIMLRVHSNTDVALKKDSEKPSQPGHQLVGAHLAADKVSLGSRSSTSTSSSDAAKSIVHLSKVQDMQDTTTTTLPVQLLDYHESRAQLCKCLSDFFPLKDDGERGTGNMWNAEEDSKINNLIATIPAAQHPDDPLNVSIMEDLTGAEPKGQVAMAIKNGAHLRKWGIHYLPSYLNAHTRQICNSFKDPGPLQYGKDSPLFVSCRNTLDTAFDKLPAPEPSARSSGIGWGSTTTTTTGGGGRARASRGPIAMSKWNSSSAPCFAASTPVLLASGRSVKIRQLKRGMRVQTPVGPRRVDIVLKTPVQSQLICRVGSLLVTPWHPISLDAKEWHFPADLANKQAVRYTGSVYSVLLQEDGDVASHAFMVGGVWGVTLGHGVVSGQDVRAHEFLGSHARVKKALESVGVGRGGIVLGGGVVRDADTGGIAGFKGFESNAL